MASKALVLHTLHTLHIGNGEEYEKTVKNLKQKYSFNTDIFVDCNNFAITLQLLLNRIDKIQNEDLENFSDNTLHLEFFNNIPATLNKTYDRIDGEFFDDVIDNFANRYYCYRILGIDSEIALCRISLGKDNVLDRFVENCKTTYDNINVYNHKILYSEDLGYDKSRILAISLSNFAEITKRLLADPLCNAAITIIVLKARNLNIKYENVAIPTYEELVKTINSTTHISYCCDSDDFNTTYLSQIPTAITFAIILFALQIVDNFDDVKGFICKIVNDANEIAGENATFIDLNNSVNVIANFPLLTSHVKSPSSSPSSPLTAAEITETITKIYSIIFTESNVAGVLLFHIITVETLKQYNKCYVMWNRKDARCYKQELINAIATNNKDVMHKLDKKYANSLGLNARYDKLLQVIPQEITNNLQTIKPDDLHEDLRETPIVSKLQLRASTWPESMEIVDFSPAPSTSSTKSGNKDKNVDKLLLIDRMQNDISYISIIIKPIVDKDGEPTGFYKYSNKLIINYDEYRYYLPKTLLQKYFDNFYEAKPEIAAKLTEKLKFDEMEIADAIINSTFMENFEDFIVTDTDIDKNNKAYNYDDDFRRLIVNLAKTDANINEKCAFSIINENCYINGTKNYYIKDNGEINMEIFNNLRDILIANNINANHKFLPIYLNMDTLIELIKENDETTTNIAIIMYCNNYITTKYVKSLATESFSVFYGIDEKIIDGCFDDLNKELSNVLSGADEDDITAAIKELIEDIIEKDETGRFVIHSSNYVLRRIFDYKYFNDKLVKLQQTLKENPATTVPTHIISKLPNKQPKSSSVTYTVINENGETEIIKTKTKALNHNKRVADWQAKMKESIEICQGNIDKNEDIAKYAKILNLATF